MAPDEPRETTPARAPSWLDVVDELLDTNFEERDEIECSLSDVDVDVPMEMGSDADHARWRFDGTVRIRSEGMRATLAEWLRYWDEAEKRRDAE